MKRRIDPVAIGSVGMYMKQQSEELQAAKNKLLTDIAKISEVYHGKDANIIISKYQNRVNSLDTIITNYENFALYMQKISNAYSNNLNESKQNLNSVLENTTTPEKATNLDSTFINLNDITQYYDV